MLNDIEDVVDHTAPLWEDLRGARLFVTGGTGFFGTWLLETFVRATDRFNLDATAVVLTRDAAAFARRSPHLAGHSAVTAWVGDIRTFTPPPGVFTHAIHAATDTQPVNTRHDRQRVFETIVDGTRRMLAAARHAGVGRFLLASTGAVYGRQPASLSHITEEFSGAPDVMAPSRSGAEAKRAAEALCAIEADATFKPTIARCFAFVGPHLPLDMHYAVGNFIRDAMQGGPIRVHGDGTAIRSYMYAADLAAWLWTILLRGEPLRPYNVGSEDALSIAEVARAVAERFDGCAIQMSTAAVGSGPVDRYVPSTARARHELDLTMTVDFQEALTRTAGWYGARGLSTHAAH